MLSSSYRLAASVISAHPKVVFSHLREMAAGPITRLHVDVMDGNFVPRLGLFPEFVADLRSNSELQIHVHMMMRHPDPFIGEFIAAGANRIVPHLEPLDHPWRTMDLVKEAGAEFGLALNPATPGDSLAEISPLLDSVTLMAINPGIRGHRLIEATFSKVRKFQEAYPWFPEIEIDGGITFENIGSLYSAGAGSFVLGAGTIFSPHGSFASNLAKVDEILGHVRLDS